jgi:heat-inducible transcriptional repressor
VIDELTVRQRRILEHIVREYIATAIPVGSVTVAQRFSPSISSATVRNEMAALEEMGYIAQPHTSAGRVPTDKGYRLFVESVMEASDLSLAERQMIQHQFHQIHLDQEQWMRLAAAMLAQTAQSTSLVTRPRPPECRLKHMELIGVQELVALLILVLQGGLVRQQMLASPQPLTQGDLTVAVNHLNALYDNANQDQIRECAVALTPLEEQATAGLVGMMAQVDERDDAEIYRDGLIHILSQPEFAQVDRLRCVLEVLEQRNLMNQLLAPARAVPGVHVIIGSESPLDQLRDYSLVLSSYGVAGAATGVLGVMGPTRMRYERAISAVRYMAEVMNSLLAELYE